MMGTVLGKGTATVAQPHANSANEFCSLHIKRTVKCEHINDIDDYDPELLIHHIIRPSTDTPRQCDSEVCRRHLYNSTSGELG